ncbi:hypothetical protein M3924_003375 [Vibrio fluvialis]|nr:hypothetical protein [Vibrio fluvialis]
MKYMNLLKKHSSKIAAGTGALVLSGAARADVAESINTAVSTGQSNYTLVVVGLIGLAAIGFGLRAIIGAMR